MWITLNIHVEVTNTTHLPKHPSIPSHRSSTLWWQWSPRQDDAHGHTTKTTRNFKINIMIHEGTFAGQTWLIRVVSSTRVLEVWIVWSRPGRPVELLSSFCVEAGHTCWGDHCHHTVVHVRLQGCPVEGCAVVLCDHLECFWNGRI